MSSFIRTRTHIVTNISKLVITWIIYSKQGREWKSAFSPLVLKAHVFPGLIHVCQIEEGLTLFPSFCIPVFLFVCFMFYFLKVTVPVSGMITIPAASLAGAQIVQTGANTNTTSSGQGTVTVTLPVAGNMVNSGGMVMVRKLLFHFIVCSLFFHVSLSLKISSACILKSLMKLMYNPDLLRLRFLRHSGLLLQ